MTVEIKKKIRSSKPSFMLSGDWGVEKANMPWGYSITGQKKKEEEKKMSVFTQNCVYDGINFPLRDRMF